MAQAFGRQEDESQTAPKIDIFAWQSPKTPALRYEKKMGRAGFEPAKA